MWHPLKIESEELKNGLDSDTFSTFNSQFSILDGLAVLVDQSLLRREVSTDDAPRFVMLETIHEYALERLVASGEESTLRERHAQYYLALAERSELLLHSAEQQRWLARLSADYGNLRAALACSQAADSLEAGLRLGGALWAFWQLGGQMSEAREQLARLLGHPAAVTPTNARVRALFAAGFFAGVQGDFALAQAQLAESHALSQTLGYRQGIAYAHYGQGFVSWLQGEQATARARHTESLAIFRELGQRWPIALTLYSLGGVEVHLGAYGRGELLLEESKQLFHELGDPVMYSHTLQALGYAARVRGDNERAVACYAECLALFQSQGNTWGIAATSAWPTKRRR